MRKFFFILLFLIPAFSAYAQHELFVGSSIEKPLGYLTWTYKSAMGINLGYNYNKNEDKKKCINYGVQMGFTSFPVLQDTFYFLLERKSYGTAVYSNYSILALDGEAKFIYRIKSFGLYEALNFGYHYISYSCQINTPGAEDSQLIIEGKGAICPKIGLQYMFKRYLGAYIDTKYNLIFSLAESDIEPINFNPNVGKVNIYLSFGAGLIFKFNKK